MQQTKTIDLSYPITGDWRQAIDLWLQSRRTPATRRSYAKALEDALITTGKLPWELNRTDVHRWIQQMQIRGLSPATVAQRLAGLSSFYSFCGEDYLVNETPLHAGNPAAGKSLRPRVEMYGKASYLDAEEAGALLRSIRRTDLQGLRDYALFLGYLMLARRNSEWRVARWGDFEQRGGKVFYHWDGKGKDDQTLEVSAPVWIAIREYLRAAGRIKAIRADEYVFTAIRRRGLPLPSGKILTANQPLSAHEVGRLLKGYLQRAGLESGRICVHSLRHSGAMLRKSSGDSIEEIMNWLGHSNLAVTQIYLHAMEGKTDGSWMKVSQLLGLEISNDR
jgi:integrase